MDGDGRFSSPMRPTSKLQLTTRKIVWAATFPQELRTGSTSKVIQFLPPSEQRDATEAEFRKAIRRRWSYAKSSTGRHFGIGRHRCEFTADVLARGRGRCVGVDGRVRR